VLQNGIADLLDAVGAHELAEPVVGNPPPNIRVTRQEHERNRVPGGCPVELAEIAVSDTDTRRP